MIRRAIGFVIALALTVIGGGGTIFLLLFAERFRGFMLVGSIVMMFVGAYWLWIDYLSPAKPEDDR
jgi:hypothetical protein